MDERVRSINRRTLTGLPPNYSKRLLLSSHVWPAVNDFYTLGADYLKWRWVYTVNLTISNAAFVAGLLTTANIVTYGDVNINADLANDTEGGTLFVKKRISCDGTINSSGNITGGANLQIIGDAAAANVIANSQVSGDTVTANKIIANTHLNVGTISFKTILPLIYTAGSSPSTSGVIQYTVPLPVTVSPSKTHVICTGQTTANNESFAITVHDINSQNVILNVCRTDNASWSSTLKIHLLIIVMH